MKSTKLLALALLLFKNVTAQTNEKFTDLKSNEISINIGNTIPNLINGRNPFKLGMNTSNSSLVLGFNYKILLRKVDYRMKLYASFSDKYFLDDYSSILIGNMIDGKPYQEYFYKLGVQCKKPQAFTFLNLKRNIDFLYGADLFFVWEERFVEAEDIDFVINHSPDVVLNQYQYGFGIGPFIGLRLPLRKHWSISSEIGLDFKALNWSDYNEVYFQDGIYYLLSDLKPQEALRNYSAPKSEFKITYSSFRSNLSIGFHF